MFQRLERIRAVMRQYTTPEQTAKLIELGFEKPKTVVERKDYGVFFPIEEVRHYSIGELIEMLPPYINNEDDEDDFFELAIYRGTKWTVAYGGIFDIKIGVTQTELIDALYDMIVKLKEEKLI